MEGLKNSIRHVHEKFLPAPISHLIFLFNEEGITFIFFRLIKIHFKISF